MNNSLLNPQDSVFVLLSFEGPDSYSLAGGLGVRVTKLSEALVGKGYQTSLFFIGDPDLEGISVSPDRLFFLHRWCQWISHYHPCGVYDGEEGKLRDYTASVPEYVLENIIRPAVYKGKKVVVMAEEWQTAEALYRIHDLLIDSSLRNHALLFWNANNNYSFERIDWGRLKKSSTITTVSRYMRHLMQPYGVEPLVINNGIQAKLTEPLEAEVINGFKKELDADLTLFKMARFDPAKGWMPAIESAARLKAMGFRINFFLRGGIEPFGQHVFELAKSLGLSIQDVNLNGLSLEDGLRELLSAQGADIVNISSFVPHELSRIMFRCSDAVLANSAHEPFGLVGLEAMASGGAAYVGMTGEDYAHGFEDAVVLETSKAEEIMAAMLYLYGHKQAEDHLRNQARSTARHFTWDQIIDNNLLPKLERVNWEQSVH